MRYLRRSGIVWLLAGCAFPALAGCSDQGVRGGRSATSHDRNQKGKQFRDPLATGPPAAAAAPADPVIGIDRAGNQIRRSQIIQQSEEYPERSSGEAGAVCQALLAKFRLTGGRVKHGDEYVTACVLGMIDGH
ncbi:hypothetical protein [Actinomadura rupiterrae]|uniref:hypothetical protein n=1 Tax=Actinomadura rupiterrae TaxID=559627 RepID=UPI0020A5916C|nr:hypothetical protein [Actinomadura rupiterrae]MCP2342590.1 hypothetical protein [Actinomadura rupiterrae]